MPSDLDWGEVSKKMATLKKIAGAKWVCNSTLTYKCKECNGLINPGTVFLDYDEYNYDKDTYKCESCVVNRSEINNGTNRAPARCIGCKYEQRDARYEPCKGCNNYIFYESIIKISEVTKSEVVQPKPLTKEKKMSTTDKLKDVLSKGIRDGVQQGAVDEVGEVFLDIAKSIVGNESVVFNTPQGRELGKAFSAMLILTMKESLNLGNMDFVEKSARLQVQTASMRLIQPHLKTLRASLDTLRLCEGKSTGE